MKLTREEIMSIVAPVRTESYTPVTNIDLISKVLNESVKNQYVLVDEKYESDSTKNKFKMKFFMQIRLGFIRVMIEKN